MSNKRKSCLVVAPWELHHAGGVNQVIVNLLREYRRRDRMSSCLLISAHGQDQLSSSESTNHVTEYRLTVRSPLSPKNRAKNFLSFLRHLPATLSQLRQIFAIEDVTSVNVHYPSLSALNYSILNVFFPGRRTRLTLSFHGADFDRAEGASGLHRLLWKLLFARAHRLVTCSDALASRIGASFPECAKKTSTVHNGVDQELLRSLASNGTMPAALNGKRFILNAATFEAKKGQDVLLRAFAAVSARFPDAVLVLMGRVAEAFDALQRLAGELAISDRVVFQTDVAHADVMATMNKASVFVLPSRIEPFGIVSLEAGTFNVPVVASRVGGIPEIIQNEVTGLLVSCDDPDQLADALCRILENADLAESLGSALRSLVEKQFSWDKAAGSYEQLL